MAQNLIDLQYQHNADLIQKLFQMQIGVPPDVNPINVNEVEAAIIAQEKKKKSRRSRNRRRHREKKDGKEQALDIVFSIKAVKSQNRHFVFFKKLNRLNGLSNLEFLRSRSEPIIFETKLNFDMPTNSTNDLVDKDSKAVPELLGTTDPNVSAANTDSQNLQNARSRHKSKKIHSKQYKPKVNENESTIFPKYLNYHDMKFGLENGNLFEGVIRINPKNFKEAYVSNVDKRSQDYYFTSLIDRNRALEGDVVVLAVKPQSQWNNGQKTACVVYIKEQVHPRTAVGYLTLFPDKNQKFAQFIPRDHRIPRMRIPSLSWPAHFYSEAHAYKNILFMAKITEWIDTRFAMGSIIESLGEADDISSETRAILLENNLDVTPFPPEVYSFVPKTKEIPEKEFSYREDFRKECVFTIDPLTAKDLDDAISCKELPNGNFEIGVHIADVSFYLEEATVLDINVAKRATTIYLVNNVYHMLPVEMCQLCSLLPGKDCLTFSVIWEMTKDGDILSTRFARTVINSCCQLAYEHAQSIIEDPLTFKRENLPEIMHGYTPEKLCDIICKLQYITSRYREKRFNDGALRIDQVKINFMLDPKTGYPLDWSIHESKDAHRLIEELMLLANITVAEKLLDHFPDIAFLRCHEAPNTRLLNELRESLSLIGIHLDIDSAAGIHTSLWKYGQDTSFLGECRIQVLNHLLAKPMTRASYICSGSSVYRHHYALNVPVYTHFTSPIRRYADIIVHRQLAAILGYTSKPTCGEEFINYLAQTSNRQKYNAKKAGEASSDLFLAHYIEKHQPFIETAVVVDVKDRSYDVMLIKTGSIVRLYLNDLGEGVKYVMEKVSDRRQNKATITFPATHKYPETQIVVQIFQILSILVKRKDKTYKLQGKLLRPTEETTHI